MAEVPFVDKLEVGYPPLLPHRVCEFVAAAMAATISRCRAVELRRLLYIAYYGPITSNLGNLAALAAP